MAMPPPPTTARQRAYSTPNLHAQNPTEVEMLTQESFLRHSKFIQEGSRLSDSQLVRKTRSYMVEIIERNTMQENTIRELREQYNEMTRRALHLNRILQEACGYFRLNREQIQQLPHHIRELQEHNMLQSGLLASMGVDLAPPPPRRQRSARGVLDENRPPHLALGSLPPPPPLRQGERQAALEGKDDGSGRMVYPPPYRGPAFENDAPG